MHSQVKSYFRDINHIADFHLKWCILKEIAKTRLQEGTEWSVMPITRLYLWVRWLSWTLDSQIREHIAEGIDNLH